MPAFIDNRFITNADADNLAVPLGFYPSRDEPRDIIQYVTEVAATKPFAAKNDFHNFDTVYVHCNPPSSYFANVVKLVDFPSSHHGFAGARAKLSDPENKKQFELFYSKASAFFQRAFEA